MGAAAAAAAMAGLTGCGKPKQQAETKAASGAAKSGDKQGVRWSWDVAPEPVPDSKIKKTVDCDICVIGAGAAGVPAAMAAAQDGAKTILLSKTEAIATNGWCVAAFNSKRFTDKGATYDIPQIFRDFSDLANGRDDGRVVNLFLRRSGEAIDYVLDNVPDMPPVLYPDEHGHSFGWYVNDDFSTRYVQFKKLLEKVLAKATDAGAEVMWSTPAEQLIKDDKGRVTGVLAKEKSGDYVRVNASKGVILATGDISDDEEMLECYCPILVGVKNMHGNPCNTGDGHKMGLWAGAKMDMAPHGIMMHFDPTWLPEGYAPYSGNPWLRVNKKGERYSNENLGYQTVVTACRLQPDQECFQIVDSNWAKHCNDYKHPNSHSRFSPAPEKDWEDSVKRGAIKKSDTIEGLADAYGIDKDTLVATVKRYNELVDKGVDEDYGVRSDYFVWNGIKEPPFYAIKRAPGVLATVGGLAVNDKLQCIDEKSDKPIEGLYAVGDASGSFYGYDYPLFITGGSLGRSIAFGVLAVKSALGTLDKPIKA